LANGQISTYETGSIKVTLNNGSAICIGDSGSPVVVKANEEYYLAAVTSAINPDISGQCGTKAIATLMTAKDYSWITKTIADFTSRKN
jgi:secreted trypsin-like serine protease